MKNQNGVPVHLDLSRGRGGVEMSVKK